MFWIIFFSQNMTNFDGRKVMCQFGILMVFAADWTKMRMLQLRYIPKILLTNFLFFSVVEENIAIFLCLEVC